MPVIVTPYQQSIVIPAASYAWDMDSLSDPEPPSAGPHQLNYTFTGHVTGQPPLANDGGNSIRFDAPAYVGADVANIVYTNGITIAYNVKATTIGFRFQTGGRMIPSVHSNSNAGPAIFELGWDNFSDSGANCHPCFTLMTNRIDEPSEYGTAVADARDLSTNLVVGVNYHMLGTVSPTGDVDLYVNGVLVASDTVNMATWQTTGSTDISDSGRALRKEIDVGGRIHDGAWRSVANCGAAFIDNVRIWEGLYTNAAQAAAIADGQFD